jgi:hypothetical protein
MDITGELINDPRFEAKMISILEKYHTGRIAEDSNDTISELEAMKILGVKSKSSMAKYREKGLPYVNGKPVKYIKSGVIEFRDKELLKKRKM